ncbi:toll/interleukin-1 receptor domain-containing protein, partial [Neoroseomonas soli]
MPHDVFLSYASADRAAADAVCAALEVRGIRCWMAPRDVPAGADWGEAILTAIGRTHAMVLILSRNTAGSVHVRNEVVTAVSQSLALVPVRIEDCQPGGALRLHLAGSHWLDVFPPPVERHADVLAAGVRLALAADATIELPREQAAALVAAARAASAGRVAPVGRVGGA